MQTEEYAPELEEVETKPKKARKEGVAQLLKRIEDLCKELGEAAALAQHNLQVEAQLQEKEDDRLRKLLNIYTPLGDLLARVPIPDSDAEFLRSKKYLRKQKG